MKALERDALVPLRHRRAVRRPSRAPPACSAARPTTAWCRPSSSASPVHALPRALAHLPRLHPPTRRSPGALRASLTPRPPRRPRTSARLNAGAERPSVLRAKLRALHHDWPGVVALPPAAPCRPCGSLGLPRSRPRRRRPPPAAGSRHCRRRCARRRSPRPPHGAPEERTSSRRCPCRRRPVLPCGDRVRHQRRPRRGARPRAPFAPGAATAARPDADAAPAVARGRGRPHARRLGQRLPPIELAYQHVPAAPRSPHGDDAPMEADAR